MPIFLREWRKRAGLTRPQVAERLGIQAPAIYKWENGISSPSARDLELLAEIFEIIPDALFHDPDPVKMSRDPLVAIDVWSAIAQVHRTAGFHVEQDPERIDEAKDLTRLITGYETLRPAARQHVLHIIESYPAEARCKSNT